MLSRKWLLVDCFASEFRSVKIRGKNPDCIACGNKASLTRMDLGDYDYQKFTGQSFAEGIPESIEMFPVERRWSPHELAEHLNRRENPPFVLIDVRPKTEFEICRLKGKSSFSRSQRRFLGSISFPFSQLRKQMSDLIDLCSNTSNSESGTPTCVVVCRRGNDSQRMIEKLNAVGVQAVDLVGGLEAWHEQIDPSFLKY